MFVENSMIYSHNPKKIFSQEENEESSNIFKKRNT